MSWKASGLRVCHLVGISELKERTASRERKGFQRTNMCSDRQNQKRIVTSFCPLRRPSAHLPYILLLDAVHVHVSMKAAT